MMDDAPPPRELLQWVRVRGMQVFWPALVYESYTEMSRQSHDVLALRNEKPALDFEDRIVYFFGITNSSSGNMNGGAYSSSVVPNLRFCVVPDEELTEFPWEGASDFDMVCRTHHIPEDTIMRAQKNSTFKSACDYAAQFHDEAYNNEHASRLLMSFLTGALTTTTSNNSNTSPTKPTKSAPTKSVSPTKAAPTPTKPTPTNSKQLPKASMTAKPTTGLSARVAAACWTQMEAMGWATLAQPDGSKLFTMPGVSFFDLRPNVTVFDALATACARFLALWLHGTDANDALETLLWSEMAGGGWQTIHSADETWFSMPNTPFDRFVPNETIFQSKRLAIAKFLQLTGVIGGSGDATEEEAAEEMQSQPEAMEEEEEEEEEEEPSASESEEEEEEEEAYAKIHKSVVRSRATRPATDEKPSLQPKRAFRKPPPPPRVVVPPFKCTPGKIEMELETRGWYWEPYKTKTDNWMYFQPHCRGKELSELEIGADCFAGRVALDTFLEMSGLYSEIVEKLRRDHEHAFLAAHTHTQPQTSTSVRSTAQSYVKKPVAVRVREQDLIEISEDQSENDVVTTVKRATRESSLRMSARSSERTKGAARRKPATSKVKRRRASIQEVKFGDIWTRLAKQGWHYRDSTLGYHCYRPTTKTKAEMVPEEDFFTTKASMIDFLKESGLWQKLANEIEEEYRAASASATPLKRKPSESTGADGEEARTPTAKKAKTTGGEETDDYHTPPTKRSSELEIPETQDLSKLEATPLVSPENAAAKSKQEGTPLARNLNDAFTPSPRGEKRSSSTKQVEHSPRELAQEAITRLSLGFQPDSFTHREAEAKQIKDFCRECFTGRRGGSLYLSGSPGCGKSALLRSLGSSIGDLKKKFGKGLNEIVPAHLNAMGLSDFNQLFCQLAEILTGHEYIDGEAAFEAIERGTDVSLKRSKVLLLVLDEIDALGKKPSMENDLCRLFELANRSTHTLILVGIANQMDFTERHLASLRVQLPDIKPQVIVFKPYSFQTISDILTDRLGGEANAAKLMNTNGIAFIARKVAAQSGDVRLALDICRRVLQQKLNDNATSDAHHVLHSFTSPIPLMDIVKTIKIVLDSKSKSNISSLPRNLQMILFASTRLVAQHSSSTASTDSSSSNASSHTLYQVEDLYSSYCDVCHDAGVFKPLSRGEFKLGLETLSSEGMIGANELKKQLIKLVCTPSELLQTFKHDAYFSRLI